MAKKDTTTEKVKVVTPQMLVKSHEQVVAKSLQQHQLEAALTVSFPNHTRTPLIGRLGVWLVNKAGGRTAIKYRFNDTITSEKSPTKE